MTPRDKDLEPVFEFLLKESVAVIGLGNPDRADDGVGIVLASILKTHFPDRIFLETERHVEQLVLDLIENPNIKTILFVDAVDFGGPGGTIKQFGVEESRRFMPSVSTHRVPIGFLMHLLTQEGKIAYLIGVQPESLELMGEMSPSVEKTVSKIAKGIICKLN